MLRSKLSLLLIITWFNLSCSDDEGPGSAAPGTENKPSNTEVADAPDAPKQLRTQEDPDKEKNITTPPQVVAPQLPYQAQRDAFIKLADAKRQSLNQAAYRQDRMYHEFAQILADIKGPSVVWFEGESFQSYTARQTAATNSLQKMKYEATMFAKYKEEFKGHNVYTKEQTIVTIENYNGSAAGLASQAYSQATSGFLNPSTGTFVGDTLGIGINCVTEEWRGRKKDYCTFVIISGNATSSHDVPGLTPVPEAPEEVCPEIPKALGTGSYTLSPWQASYYNDSELVHTEKVSTPAINYIYNEFHSIPSSKFRASWETEINVSGVDQLLRLEFYLSWSTAKISVNEVEIFNGANSNQDLQHLFKVGKSRIKVEFANNWHTTMFNLQLKQSPKLIACQAESVVKKLITADTDILYAGIYESSERYNQVKVSLAGRTRPVALFFASYEPVNLVIDNPNGVAIKGIFYSSYGNGSIVQSKLNNIFEVKNMPYYSSDDSTITEQIFQWLGRTPNATAIIYDTYEISI